MSRLFYCQCEVRNCVAEVVPHLVLPEGDFCAIVDWIVVSWMHLKITGQITYSWEELELRYMFRVTERLLTEMRFQHPYVCVDVSGVFEERVDLVIMGELSFQSHSFGLAVGYNQPSKAD